MNETSKSKKKVLYFATYNANAEFYNEQGKGFWGNMLLCYKEVFDLYIVLFNKHITEPINRQSIYGINNVQVIMLPWKKKINYFPTAGLYKSIIPYFSDIDIDYVICQNASPFALTGKLFARRYKAKFIIHEHTLFRTIKEQRTVEGVKSWHHILRSLGLFLADHIITPSQYLANDIQKNVLMCKNVSVIPNPVFNICEKNNKSCCKKTAVAIANWHLNKNLALLIAAFNKVNNDKELKLIVIGHITEIVQNSISELNTSNVEFTGHLQHDIAIDYLKNASMFILPSQYESFSLPVVEAMLLKIPVVSTRCGAPEEILAENRGLICDINVNSLAKSINQVIEGRSSVDLEAAYKWVKENTGKNAIVNAISNIL